MNLTLNGQTPTPVTVSGSGQTVADTSAEPVRGSSWQCRHRYFCHRHRSTGAAPAAVRVPIAGRHRQRGRRRSGSPTVQNLVTVEAPDQSIKHGSEHRRPWKYRSGLLDNRNWQQHCHCLRQLSRLCRRPRCPHGQYRECRFQWNHRPRRCRLDCCYRHERVRPDNHGGSWSSITDSNLDRVRTLG